ncbi:MAG: tetratricopeptide repeat protein [Planctomycetes bacterium]|nr:tetratricopeptide repeat protein [Planctomycetota bacterium]
MDERSWTAKGAAALLLSTALASVLALGVLGCQGCQSGSTGGETGDPDEVLSGSKKDGSPGRPGDPPPAGPEAAAPDPESARLEEAIEFVEDELMAFRGRVMGKGSADLGDVKRKFLEEVRERADKDRENDKVQFLLGWAFLLNENTEKALECFRAVVARDPGFLPAWKGIALIRARDKDEAGVREALDRLQSPRIEGPYGRILFAEFLAEGGKEQEAEKILLETRAKFPGNVRALLDLVDLYRMRRRWEEAFDALEKAIQRAPDEPKVWFYKAETHSLRIMSAMEERNPEAAAPHRDLLKDALDKCWKLAPDSVLGKMAKETLESVNNPQDRMLKIVLDPAQPPVRRLEAARYLAADPSKIAMEDWKKILALPEKELRAWALIGLGNLGTAEALAEVGAVAARGPFVDRSPAVSVLAEVQAREPDLAPKRAPVVVPALLAALKTCVDNFESKGLREESDFYADILEALSRWTGKHWGEGRSHRALEGMKETLAEWERWWAGEAGAPGSGGGAAGGGEEKKG